MHAFPRHASFGESDKSLLFHSIALLFRKNLAPPAPKNIFLGGIRRFTLKTELRREFDHTDAVDVFIWEFVVGIGEQDIPRPAL